MRKFLFRGADTTSARSAITWTVLASFAYLILPSSEGDAAAVQVFVVAGQSNAVGAPSARGLPDSLTDQTDVLYWYEVGGTTSRDRFVDLGPVNGTFGPELALGRTLSQRLSDDVAVVKVAFGGTTLAMLGGSQDWSPNSSRELYDKLVDNVNAANSALLADNRQPQLAGLFWMQGESDGKSGNLAGGQSPPPQPETAEAYADNLTDFITRVRTDLGLAQLPVLVGKIKIGDNPGVTTNPDSDFNTSFGEWGYTPTIQAAQVAVAAADSNVFLVETNQISLGSDFLHFDQAGQVDLGEAFAEAYLVQVPEPSCFVLLTVALTALLGSRMRIGASRRRYAGSRAGVART